MNDCELWYDYLENFCVKFFVGGFRNGIFKSENVNSFFKEEDFLKDEIDMV